MNLISTPRGASVQTGLIYPELPETMRRSGPAAALRLFGPGAIVASVSIGSGETLFASRTGAIFEYGLLWFVLLCVLCKLVPVYAGARYMVLTGEHPMEAWARLPGPRAWFPILLSLLSFFCFPFWMGGLSMMVGTAINWIGGLDAHEPGMQQLYARLFGTGFLLVVMVLILFQSYGTLEKIQIAIVAILLVSILAAVGVAPVNWPAALKGMFTIGGTNYPEWIGEKYPAIAATSVVVVMTTFMGAIGGGTYDYIGYLSLFREKGWGALDRGEPAGQSGGTDGSAPAPAGGGTGMLAHASDTANNDTQPGGVPAIPAINPAPANMTAGRRWLRAPVTDVFISFGCVLVFTVAFTILGAAVLHPTRDVPAGFALLSPQARFLDQFGAGFRYLYQVGIFMAFWGTIYGGLEVYCRTGYECLRPIFSGVRHVPYRRFRLPVCLYAGLGGILLMWLMDEPMAIVQPAALLGSLTCGLWCFAIVWADHRFLPAGLRMNRPWIAFNLLAGALLTAFSAKAIFDYAMG